MRAVHLSDLVVATRVLCGVHPFLRAERAARMLAKAHAADKLRRRLGHGHPLWGDGTLAAAAQGWPGPCPAQGARGDWLSVLALLLAEIRRWRRARQRPRR